MVLLFGQSRWCDRRLLAVDIALAGEKARHCVGLGAVLIMSVVEVDGKRALVVISRDGEVGVRGNVRIGDRGWKIC